MGEAEVMVDVARYQYICADHGPCGSAKVTKRKAPAAPRCPLCRATVETWVGSCLPDEDQRWDVGALLRAG
jgi:hypothetical protein